MILRSNDNASVLLYYTLLDKYLKKKIILFYINIQAAIFKSGNSINVSKKCACFVQNIRENFHVALLILYFKWSEIIAMKCNLK